MLLNIIDNRKRLRRWKSINAAVEPTSHDNEAPDSDFSPETHRAQSYDECESISLNKAVAWAESLAYPVTLYIYDEGDGITSIRHAGS